MKKLLDDLRNLDARNIGGWSNSVRMFFSTVLFILVVFLGWYLHVSNQQAMIKDLINREFRLKQEFMLKQTKAANLNKLQQYMEKTKEMLRKLLRQLPSKTEMPAILTNISRAASSAGLQVVLFQPHPEITRDFYAEKPVQLKMIGTYHQFGHFFSNVAALPKLVIMIMHDVSLTPLNKTPETRPVPNEKLVLQGTVRTYRYLDENEARVAACFRKGGKVEECK